ncbi:MAG TPA: hypothetical protein VNP72_09390 [Longimicrobium sp.]|nr:hypothetical protein [Longimicrobium sp.]
MTIRPLMLLILAAALAACDTFATTVEGWPEDGVTPATGTYQYELRWRREALPDSTAADSASLGSLVISNAGTGGFTAEWGVSGYGTTEEALWDGTAYVLSATRSIGARFTVTHRLHRQDGVGSLTCEAAATPTPPDTRTITVLGCRVIRIRAAPPES